MRLDFESTPHAVAPHPIEPPQLLWPLEARHKIFFRNLADLLFRRRLPPLALTAKPATFWADVFVDRRVSVRALMDSALLHVLALVAVIAFTETFVFRQPPALHDAFTHTRLTFYEVSEYLPEVHTAALPSEALRKPAREGVPEAPADPTYAKQEIISVPPDPDNLRQTIVTPSELRLRQDVPLPNIVTAQPPKPVDVLTVANRPAPKLAIPREILAPKLKIAMAPPEIANASLPKPVEVLEVANRPGPKSLDVTEAVAPKLAIGMAMPEVGTGAVPAAAPAPLQVANGRVQRNLPAGPEVSAPALSGSVPAPNLASGPSSTLPAPAKAAPSSDANGAGKTADAAQHILALSTQPAAAVGPLAIPNGSRRGTFAAGLEGHADATGAPASTPGKSAPATNASGAPSGIHVGASGDTAPHTGIVAAGAPAVAAGNLRSRMLAMATASPTIPPPRVQPETTAKPDNDATAKAVFGDKRYYKLTVNMPNLTSASGSWIIRFAELHPQAAKAQIALAAPMALSKSDPAYPPDLMNDKVEGTVILYAVIRADGSITDVKVLNSVNVRLDQSAMAALHKWRFQPGSKDNQPVDVEAVVQVPFRVKRLSY